MAHEMSKLSAKAAGKTKAIGKMLKGETGILRHLAAEHGEVGSLMKKVASSDDPKVCEDLFPEIRAALTAHAEAEEAEFYPPLQRFPRAAPLVERSLREHAEIKQLLHQLDSDALSDATWEAMFARLQTAVEQHVALEENELFPIAKELCDGDELKEMLERFEPLEKSIKERTL